MLLRRMSKLGSRLSGGARQNARKITPKVLLPSTSKMSRSFSLHSRQEGTTKGDMFCFQCEQTDNNVGCEEIGVCGKTPQTAYLQDLLVHYMKGIAQYARVARANGKTDKRLDHFFQDGLFATLTNVNFDAKRFHGYLRYATELRDIAKSLCPKEEISGFGPDDPANFEFVDDIEVLEAQGREVGVVERSKDVDENIYSLKEMTVYGMKGLAAYASHARHLGYDSEEVLGAMEEILDTTARENDFETALANCLRVGEVNVKVMEMLEHGHCSRYGNPTPTKVRRKPRPGKCILISGHDIHDLELLLKATEGKGINIYTHGEMLPAHGYPEIRKYYHLVGHFGGPWQLQNFEFRQFPGAILMTTNCLKPPRKSYKDRIFTTLVTGHEDIQHMGDSKAYHQLIQKALECEGFSQEYCEEFEDEYFTVGYGSHTILSIADQVVDAIKAGQIKRFFVMGGCDGMEGERSYYRNAAISSPDDSVILTMGCGKYRFNDLDLGDIGGIPRVLDLGQCNDAYGGVKVAMGLADALNMDFRDLPVSFVVSWFEQKAVAVLLSLLHLNVRDIRLGPRLPAFISPGVLDFLVENYNIKKIGDSVEEDMKLMMEGK